MASLIEGTRTVDTLSVLLGTDLQEVASVEHSIATFGERYVSRVYTTEEARQCRDDAGRPVAHRLAARFAAKESVIKAFKLEGGIAYTSIEVRLDLDGSPHVVLHGDASDAALRLGIGSSALSLTHDGAYAAATFVALASAPHPRTASQKEPT